MKDFKKLFTINKKEALECLESVSRVISKKSPEIALSNIKIEYGPVLMFSATDLEIFIFRKKEIASEEESGFFLIDGLMACKIVKTFKNQSIDFYGGKNTIFLTDGASEFQINSMDVSYPSRSVENFSHIVTIKSDTLRKVLENAFLNVEEKESGSFQIILENNKLFFLAKDRRRLSFAEAEINFEGQTRIGLNGKVVKEIISICAENEKDIKISTNGPEFLIEKEGNLIVFKASNTDKVNFLSLCDTKVFQEIVVETKLLKDAAKNLKVIVSQITRSLNCEFDINKIILNVFNPDQVKGKQEIEAKCSFKSQIKLNVDYLSDAIELIKDPEVKIFFKDSQSQIVLQDSHAKHLIMPIRM